MDDTAANDGAYDAALARLLPYERIARLVIALRMERGVSQEELAHRVGTSASAIARLESGQHRPTVETLRRVARGLDTDLVIGFRPPPRRRRSESDRVQVPASGAVKEDERHLTVV